jgi:hypothetical protein
MGTHTINANNENLVETTKAHYGALLADGISGPLIIHSLRDPLVRGRDFDHDQILFMKQV